jgi:hypothetical protein
MAINWLEPELAAVQQAINANPIASGRCAILARKIRHIGSVRDNTTQGLQILPTSAARYLAARHPHAKRWAYHVLVSTHAHYVDAMTGAAGSDPARYLSNYFDYPDQLQVQAVDVTTIDPHLQDL